VQFIAVLIHATRPPIQDRQTFANAQSHITDFDSTHGYSPESVRLFDLTQAEYPIVWRNEGDWDRYVGAYFKLTYYDSTGQLRRRKEPDLPGIAIIDLTRVPSPRGPREPGTPSDGRISAVRFGMGEIVGHDIRINGRLQSFSNLNATSQWVDRQISQILGNPLTFGYSHLIFHLNLGVLRRFLGHLISGRYGDEIQPTIEKYLLAYLQKGVKPPATIAPAILNMADDYISGKTLDLRPGDHFAIQNYLRRKKTTTKGKPKS
jgi:hypothetical protein